MPVVFYFLNFYSKKVVAWQIKHMGMNPFYMPQHLPILI